MFDSFGYQGLRPKSDVNVVFDAFSVNYTIH